MQREVIRPMVDQPVVVKLDKSDGVQREGKYGIDFQYTVNDDSGVMWLPRDGRDALLRAGAQAGDAVEILKEKRGRDFIFNVRLVGDAFESNLKMAINGNGHNAAPIPRRAYYQPGVATAPPRSNGSQGTPAGAGAPSLLGRCLREAIDAIEDATAYGAHKGRKLEFNEEDIRTCGLSLYIAATRGNR